MNKNLIFEGDLVTVNFHNSQYTLGTDLILLHRFGHVGDFWVFKDSKTEAIHYVGESCTITKNKKIDSKNIPF